MKIKKKLDSDPFFHLLDPDDFYICLIYKVLLESKIIIVYLYIHIAITNKSFKQVLEYCFCKESRKEKLF